jgi:hypothetical protein
MLAYFWGAVEGMARPGVEEICVLDDVHDDDFESAAGSVE